MTPEGKQLVIGRMDALPLLEEHAGGGESEGDAVAAVAEREEMPWISSMRARQSDRA
jgi:hypothetical protein